MYKKRCISILVVPMLLCSCFIGGSASVEFDKGVKLANEGNVKQAFKSFKSAAQKSPDSARYHFAAAQTAPDQNSAFMYTKAAWEKGLKNKAVFFLLLKLSFHVDKEKKLEYALNLLRELPDSVATDVFRGDIYYEFGNADKAYELWNSVFLKTHESGLCAKIAQALARLGKNEQAIAFLTQCKKEMIIDAEGCSLLASLLAMQFNFKDVDQLFAELASSNLYNDGLRLDQATYLVFNGRFEEAAPLLSRKPGPGSAAAQAVYGLRFHTLLLYSKIMQGDMDAAKALLDVKTQDTIFKGKIDTLFAAIKTYSKNDTGAFSALLKARGNLPPDPVTAIFNARAAQQRKKYKEAAALYEQLPSIVLWSPQLVAERAQAVALSGNEDKALSIISFMHKQRIFSRQSLELFRNLTLKKDLIDKSEAAQKFLEERYSNDVGLKWKGLLLAIKQEKTDSALGIARQLRSAYPDDERFELTALTLMLLKKEFRQVLTDAGTSKLPPQKIKPIEAAAWKGLGDTAAAIKAYEAAIKAGKEPLLKMQLAEMYFQSKEYGKATGLYTELLGDTADSLFGDSLKVAVLLNNNAWTMMTAGTGDMSGALAMAKKAYDLVPQNLNILDTYVSILLEAKKYKECIALLEPNTPALAQKRLLCHLSTAYEKRGDRNKAKRYLEDVLKLNDIDQKLTRLLSDEKIRSEIVRLSGD